MAYYYKLGKIPPKRHTQFRQADNSLYQEELVSSIGFSGIYSNLYHIYPPTRIKQVLESVPYGAEIVESPLRQTHLKTSEAQNTSGDYLEARQTFDEKSGLFLFLFATLV